MIEKIYTQEDFQLMRVKDIHKYKLLCKQYIKTAISSENIDNVLLKNKIKKQKNKF